MAVVNYGAALLQGAEFGQQAVDSYYAAQDRRDAETARDWDTLGVAAAQEMINPDGSLRSFDETKQSPIIRQMIASGAFRNALPRDGVDTDVTDLFEGPDGRFVPEIVHLDKKTGQEVARGPQTEQGKDSRAPEDRVVSYSGPEVMQTFAAVMAARSPQFREAYNAARAASAKRDAANQLDYSQQMAPAPQNPPAPQVPATLQAGAAQSYPAQPPARPVAVPLPGPQAGGLSADEMAIPTGGPAGPLTLEQAAQIKAAPDIASKVALARRFGVAEADIQGATRGAAGAAGAAPAEEAEEEPVRRRTGLMARSMAKAKAREAEETPTPAEQAAAAASARKGAASMGVKGGAKPLPAEERKAVAAKVPTEGLTNKAKGVVTTSAGPYTKAAVGGEDPRPDARRELQDVRPGRKVTRAQRDALTSLYVMGEIDIETFDRAMRSGGRLSKADVQVVQSGNRVAFADKDNRTVSTPVQIEPDAPAGGPDYKTEKEKYQAISARNNVWYEGLKWYNGGEPPSSGFLSRAAVSAAYFGMEPTQENIVILGKANEITQRLEEADAGSKLWPPNWFRDGRKYVSDNVGVIAQRMGLQNADPSEIKDRIVTPALLTAKQVFGSDSANVVADAARLNELGRARGMTPTQVATYLRTALDRGISIKDATAALRGE